MSLLLYFCCESIYSSTYNIITESESGVRFNEEINLANMYIRNPILAITRGTLIPLKVSDTFMARLS